MADLISREDAVKAIDELIDKTNPQWLQDICTRNGLISAQWCVKSLPAVNRWIPCSERLPVPLQNVIICTVIKTVNVAWINGNEWHFADTGNGHIEHWGFDDVTHWMPLPEPPESEVQE